MPLTGCCSQLYVGNVRFHLVEDDLADFFGDHDAIANVVIPFDHVLNRPKGFAYIEFKTREALERALTFDGQVRSADSKHTRGCDAVR